MTHPHMRAGELKPAEWIKIDEAPGAMNSSDLPLCLPDVYAPRGQENCLFCALLCIQGTQ